MSGEELQLVKEAFNSNYIAPIGPMIDRFEAEFADYVGIPHCLCLSSGTAAMHLALCELGVGPGDFVIASSLTFIGSISSVVHLGAELIFIDSDEASWNLDPELLEIELKEMADQGNLPKAVIPTDLYGQCVNLPRIMEICQAYDIPVICDSAEAMGASIRGKHAGFGASAAIYSFNGNKIITSSGGGMLASENKDLIDHARFLATQARDPAPHYEHTEVGYNYRMSNVVAAIGLGQLHVLDERVNQRRKICAAYQEQLGDLPGISFMPEAEYGRSNRWLTVILVDPVQFGASREDIRLSLESDQIESRPVWKPMHLQPVFRENRMIGGAVAERFFEFGLCLPSGSQMSDSDIERVCEKVRSCGFAS